MRRVLRASDRALLVEEADLGSSMRVHAALAAELEAGGLVGVTELIPAARTILVPFDPSRVDESALWRHLLDVEPADERASHRHVVTIPVHYDGEDLAEVPGMTQKFAFALAATPWGLATDNAFFPATAWFES